MKQTGFGLGEAGSRTDFAEELGGGEEGMWTSDVFGKMLCPEMLLLGLRGVGKARRSNL